MDLFTRLLELCGTVAFAISGATVGLGKRMDLFGVMILGLTTATGGGVVRDLVLGVTPPATFTDPSYALIALLVSALIFIPRVRQMLHLSSESGETFMLLADSLGLGIFTVVGVNAAIVNQPHPTMFLILFVAVITGVGGGLLRDMMAGNTPYIFVRHIYAVASLVGALVCRLLWSFGVGVAMPVGTAVVVAIRCLSAHYRWNLPRSHGL